MKSIFRLFNSKKIATFTCVIMLIMAFVFPISTFATNEKEDINPEINNTAQILEVPYEQAVNEALSKNALFRNSVEPGGSAFGIDQEGPLFPSGMAKIGSAKVIGLLVDFPDKEFESGDTKEAFEQIINGASSKDNTNYPFESLSAFYKRASYGQLEITGDVYVYHAKENREHYDYSADELFEEALTYLDPSVDFTQYDANNDGAIDCVYLHFAGGDTGWNTQWWSKAWYATFGPKYDGKEAFNRVYLHNPSNSVDGLHTIIHETGHTLGLPDLYSYGSTSTGRTGTLSWDLMENNTGDINGYFKWLLGWIKDDQILRVVANEDGTVVKKNGEIIQTILPKEDGSSSTILELDSFDSDVLDECGGFIIVSNKDEGKYAKFYVIQYETYAGNQSVKYYEYRKDERINIPNGFRIYRVQSTLLEYGNIFKYTNTAGNTHNQLIEVLDMDEKESHTTTSYTVPKGINQESYDCLLNKGEMVDYSTYPSTNFEENNALGFTGLFIKNIDSETGTGKVEIGFNPEGKQEPQDFELEIDKSYLAINDLKVTFTTPWAVSQEGYDVMLYVNDKLYNASARLVGNEVRVSKYIDPDELKRADKCKIVFPEGTFKIAEIDYVPVYSKELTYEIPVGPQAELENPVKVEALKNTNSANGISNVVTIGDKAYVAWIDLYGTGELHLVSFDKDNPQIGKDSIVEGFSKDFFTTVNTDALTLYTLENNRLILSVHTSDRDTNKNMNYYWIDINENKLDNSYVLDENRLKSVYGANVAVGDDGTIFMLTYGQGKLTISYISDNNGIIEEASDSIEGPLTNTSIFRVYDQEKNKNKILLKMFKNRDLEKMEESHDVYVVDSTTLKDLIKDKKLSSELERKSDYYELTMDSGYEIYSMQLAKDKILVLGKKFVEDGKNNWVQVDDLLTFSTQTKQSKQQDKINVPKLTLLDGSELYNINVDGNRVAITSESRNKETGNGRETILFNLDDVSKYDSTKDCGKYFSTNIHTGGYFLEDNYVTFQMKSDYTKGSNDVIIYTIKFASEKPMPEPVDTGDKNNTNLLLMLLFVSICVALYSWISIVQPLDK